MGVRAMTAIIPPFILALIVQRHIVCGLTLGAVRSQAANSPLGGVFAPVMKATASDIEKSLGLMTHSRRPSR
jgi:hypothetical protein